MAINIPIITSLEDTGIKNAKAAFNDFKSAVGNAEGGMGKFKAGANSVMDSVKANAGAFALAGAAAFVGFAKKSITTFCVHGNVHLQRQDKIKTITSLKKS